jgi:hypothetical protein
MSVGGDVKEALSLVDGADKSFFVDSVDVFSKLECLPVSHPIWLEQESFGTVGWSSLGVSDEFIEAGAGCGQGALSEGVPRGAPLWSLSSFSVQLIPSLCLLPFGGCSCFVGIFSQELGS